MRDSEGSDSSFFAFCLSMFTLFQEKHVLQRHELRDMFRGSWDVLRDEIVTDNDHGRTLVQFVARKRAVKDDTSILTDS